MINHTAAPVRLIKYYSYPIATQQSILLYNRQGNSSCYMSKLTQMSASTIAVMLRPIHEMLSSLRVYTISVWASGLRVAARWTGGVGHNWRVVLVGVRGRGLVN